MPPHALAMQLRVSELSLLLGAVGVRHFALAVEQGVEEAEVDGAVVILLVNIPAKAFADIAAVFEHHLAVVGPVVALLVIHTPIPPKLSPLLKVLTVLDLRNFADGLYAEVVLKLKSALAKQLLKIKFAGIQVPEEFIVAITWLEYLDVILFKHGIEYFEFILHVRLE